MKYLCWVLAAAGGLSLASVSLLAGAGGGAPRQLGTNMMQCCECSEYLGARTGCDKYECPECPVRRQSRTM